MTKHTKPTITGIRNDIPMPVKKKPGIKPYDSDRQFVETAINGIKNGKYKSINNAAELIASEIAYNKNYEATKRRLFRKISAILK